VQGDVQFLHSEAVVNFKGEMIEEHSFVSLEEEPVFDFTNGFLLVLSFFVLLRDGFIDVLFLTTLVIFCGVDDRDALFLCVVGEFYLLYDFFIFEVDLVHFGRHVEFIP
jgi:hypothetical protein